MSISKIMSNEPVINNAQAAPMQKAESAPEAATAPVIAGKEAFDNPAEIAGRSQINFKGGALSVRDLNRIAESRMLDSMNKEEISTAKNVIKDLMAKYKCSNLSDLSNHFYIGKIDIQDLLNDISGSVKKYNPESDLEKINLFILSIM